MLVQKHPKAPEMSESVGPEKVRQIFKGTKGCIDFQWNWGANCPLFLLEISHSLTEGLLRCHMLSRSQAWVGGGV